MLDVEGFILVGGASRRMGTDKSQLVINGKTTVQMIAEALEPATSRVRLVGAAAETVTESIPDVHYRWGPLGGIQAALRACRTECCVIVACDLPFVTSNLFAHLLDLMRNSEGVAQALVPLQSDGRPQPLCAVYKRVPCLAASEAAIAAGEHSPRAMLDKISTRYVEFETLAGLPASENFFLNLNRPEDYESARQIAASRQKPIVSHRPEIR